MSANPFEGQLERLARTLTEQFGVQVVCQGDNAWTDGRQIVLPSVPNPLDEALERCLIGYLDHEMGHVAFSDFQVAEAFTRRHPGFEGLLNVVEDALIERRAMQRWPGVRRNLDMMFEQIRGRVVQLIAQRGPFDRFCTAVYLKLSHHRDMLGLEGEVVGYEDLLHRFPTLQNTQNAAELAEALLNRWLTRNSGRQSRGGASKDQQPGPNSSGRGPQAEASKTGDSSPSPQGQSDGSGQSMPGDDSAEGDSSSANPSAPEDGEASAQSAPGEPNPSPGTDQADTAAGAGSGAGGFSGPGTSLISDALTEAIAAQVQALQSTQQYRPFSKAHDHIEVVANAPPAEVQNLLQSGTDTVRRLRRGLTNALRSAEKRWWRDDQTRGLLSPRTLYRLCTDRRRLDVFRTRSMIEGQSTAVSIVLDASGSMTSRKMEVARSAMRVLLEALADLKVATEAFTFTTGNRLEITQVCQQTQLEPNRLRERYARIANLEIGLIKRFAECVKAALARLPSIHGSGLTPLGEAMQIGASRLAVRPETRKILLVLTDGKAGCEGSTESAMRHAQHVAGVIQRAGIELVGVGIQDPNVSEVVKDSIVIEKLEDLPAQLCKLLGRTLRKGLCHVG